MNPQKQVKIRMDKQKAIGGRRGYGTSRLFDSGCNLSGVMKVIIRLSENLKIHSIYLDFARPNGLVPFYMETKTQPINRWYIERDFEVNAGDSIVRIDVWTENDILQALQFHTKHALISELFGVPDVNPNANCKVPSKVTSFEGKRPGSMLVGVHGTFYRSGVLSLGFTFAAVVGAEETMGFPPAEKGKETEN